MFVGSSVIASQIVSICRGYGKHFTINIGKLGYVMGNMLPSI